MNENCELCDKIFDIGYLYKKIENEKEKAEQEKERSEFLTRMEKYSGVVTQDKGKLELMVDSGDPFQYGFMPVIHCPNCGKEISKERD